MALVSEGKLGEILSMILTSVHDVKLCEIILITVKLSCVSNCTSSLYRCHTGYRSALRGELLLDHANLTQSEKLMILTSTFNDLEFDTVAEALVKQHSTRIGTQSEVTRHPAQERQRKRRDKIILWCWRRLEWMV